VREQRLRRVDAVADDSGRQLRRRRIEMVDEQRRRLLLG
jgi:hypothetical protein